MPKTLDELMATGSAWPQVEDWIRRAKNPVEILPGDRARGEDALSTAQIGLDTPLGAIAFHTGGLLVDHGWVRVLGAGHPRIAGSLTSWNAGTSGALFVGYDVLGGFFALDLGAFGRKVGNVVYFAPADLRWEDLGAGYAQWLAWAFDGEIEKFYGRRWDGWKDEVAALEGDEGFTFQPPLNQGGVVRRVRRPKRMMDIWAEQLGRAMGARRVTK